MKIVKAHAITVIDSVTRRKQIDHQLCVDLVIFQGRHRSVLDGWKPSPWSRKKSQASRSTNLGAECTLRSLPNIGNQTTMSYP